MGYAEISEIIRSITYKPGWRVVLKIDRNRGNPYLQVEVDATAEASVNSLPPHERAPWRGGKVQLSYFMCRQEIVGAAFGAIRAAEEHEMREWFRYRGASIFNPHLDPDALASVARKASSFNVRENAMSMTEGVDG